MSEKQLLGEALTTDELRGRLDIRRLTQAEKTKCQKAVDDLETWLRSIYDRKAQTNDVIVPLWVLELLNTELKIIVFRRLFLERFIKEGWEAFSFDRPQTFEKPEYLALQHAIRDTFEFSKE